MDNIKKKTCLTAIIGLFTVLCLTLADIPEYTLTTSYTGADQHPTFTFDTNYSLSNFTDNGYNFSIAFVNGTSLENQLGFYIPMIVHDYTFNESTSMISSINATVSDCELVQLYYYVPIEIDGEFYPANISSQTPFGFENVTTWHERKIGGTTEMNMAFYPISYFSSENQTYICKHMVIEVNNYTREENAYVNITLDDDQRTHPTSSYIDFAYDIENSGEYDAKNMTLNVSLPDGFNIVSGDCWFEGNVTNHTEEDISCGIYSPNYTVATNVTLGIEGHYYDKNNTLATVNTTFSYTIVPYAQLQITTNTSLILAGNYTFNKTILLDNFGNITVNNVTIYEYLPNSTYPTDYSGTYNATQNLLYWNLTTLDANSTYSVDYTLNVNETYLINSSKIEDVVFSVATYDRTYSFEKYPQEVAVLIAAPSLYIVNLTKEIATFTPFINQFLLVTNVSNENLTSAEITNDNGFALFGLKTGNYTLSYTYFNTWEHNFSITTGDILDYNMSIPYSNTTFKAFLNSTTMTLVDAIFDFYYEGENTYESTENYIVLPALNYTVNLTYDNYFTYVENVTLEKGNDKEINITIPATDATFTVQNGFGANDLIPNATIRFYTDTGVDTDVEILTNASGKASVTLPQATYNVTVTFGFNTYTTQVTLNDYEQNLTIDLPLLDLTFTASLDANNDTAAANVKLYLVSDNDDLYYGVCDANGQVNINNIVYGGYTIYTEYYGKNYTTTDYLALGDSSVNVNVISTNLDLTVGFYDFNTELVYPSAGGKVQIYRGNDYLFDENLDGNGTAFITLPQDNYKFQLRYWTYAYYNTTFNLTQSYMVESIVVNDVIKEFDVDVPPVFYVNSPGWIKITAESMETIDTLSLRVYSDSESTTYTGTIMDKVAYLYESITLTNTNSRWFEVVITSNNTEKKYLREMIISSTYLFNSSVYITGDLIVGGSGGSGNSGVTLFVNTTTKRVGIGTGSPEYDLDVNGTINAQEDLCIDGDCIDEWSDVHLNYWGLEGSNIYYDTGDVWVNNSLAVENTICINDQCIDSWSDVNKTPGLWSGNDDDVYYVSGNVGVGTDSPSSDLEVNGSLETTNLYDNDGSNFFDGGCGDNQHVVSIGADGTITCADDSADITSVNSGVGTKGGASSGDATIEFDCSEVTGSGVRCDDENINVYSLSSQDGLDDDVVYVDNDGEVGIGTTMPSSKLEVNGNLETTNLYDNDGTNFFDGSCGGNEHVVSIAADGTITCAENTGDISGVDSGVGTKGGASSGYATIEFDCSEVAGSGVRCDDESINVYSLSSQDGLDDDVVYVDNDGEVGVGTTMPSSKFEVNGNIETTNLYDNDGSNFFDGSCGDDQHVVSIAADGTITCADNSGDISSITAGEGIQGGGTTGDVTVDFDCSEVSGSGVRCDGEDINVYSLSSQDGLDDDVVYVDNDGEVGVGTTTPSSQFEVNGNLETTNLYDNDGTNFFDGTCGANQHVVSIAADGTITCADNSGDISSVDSGVGTKGGASSGDATIEFDCSEVTGSGVRCDDENINVYSLSSQDGLDDDVVYVDNDGEVGVGTTMPSSDLEVNGNLETTNLYDNDGTNFFDGTCGANEHVASIAADGTITCAESSGDISSVTAGEGIQGGGTTGDLTVDFDCSEVSGSGVRCDGEDINVYSLSSQDGLDDDVVYVDNDGQVGIGDTMPDYPLDVNGDINTQGDLCIAGDCHSAWSEIESQWSETGSDIYYNDGDVGIGTTSPDKLLHIEGSGAQFLVSEDASDTHFVTLDSWDGSKSQLIWDSSDDFQFASMADVSGTGYSSKVTIEGDTGNLGVGTTSPRGKLNVKTTASGTTDLLYLETSDATQSNEIGMVFNNGVADVAKIRGYVGETGNNGGGIKFVLRDGNDGSMDEDVVFKKTGSDGRVGIGTTNPQEKLDVNGKIRATELCDESGSNCKDISGGWSSVDGHSLDASDGTPTDAVYVYEDGNVGIGTTGPEAKLDVRGTAIFNNQGGDNDFRIEGDTDDFLFITEASTDSVGIGYYPPGAKLHVGGNIKQNDDQKHYFGTSSDGYIEYDSSDELQMYTTTAGSDIKIHAESEVIIEGEYGVTIGGNGGDLNLEANSLKYIVAEEQLKLLDAPDQDQTKLLCYDPIQMRVFSCDGKSSSIKKKTNITKIKYGLKEVLQAKPVFFEFKELNTTDRARYSAGFIAEWEDNNMPRLVSDDYNGDIDGFNYRAYTAVLTKAIKEQQQIIKELKKDNNGLEKTVGKLEQDIEILMNFVKQFDLKRTNGTLIEK